MSSRINNEIYVHIKRLRKKFYDSHGWKIATVWGIGYKFENK
ncbi:MAG: winged helix-turn-helix domain-containing protein [Lachnospiraceae bacterium]|nr:winged helix-turn-helix domain-containing protein [Lachnospiraceae bacterium]